MSVITRTPAPITPLTKAEVETLLLAYFKLGGREVTQEASGAEAKAAVETKGLVIRPYPGSAGKMEMGISSFKVQGFSIGGEIEGGLKVTGGGALESGSTILGGVSKETGVSLTQLAFKQIETTAEITANRGDYAALNAKPTAWYRTSAKPNLAIFGIEHAGLAEGKVYVLTNVGTNAIDLAGENTECATVTDRFKIAGTEKTNSLEATISAAALTELKEITNFRFLYPGSGITDSGGVIKAGTTINSISVAGKTAIMSAAATGEHAKEAMTASYAHIITIEPNQTVWIGYDTKSERWRIIGGPSG